MEFTAEQLRKGIERQKKEAAKARSCFRLSLAQFYEKRALELQQRLEALEGAVA